MRKKKFENRTSGVGMSNSANGTKKPAQGAGSFSEV
jgi:hypothetical protein